MARIGLAPARESSKVVVADVLQWLPILLRFLLDHAKRPETTMSAPELTRFVTDIHADAALRERLEQESGSIEALVEAARAHGYDFSLDELKATLRDARSGAAGELTEEQLEGVQGGLVVIAIIAILIGLLVPAVQTARGS
jgi:predicted ribosomally synthesized peptide with nif11-like leader